MGQAFKHILFWLLFLLLWNVHDLNYNLSFLENLRTNAIPFLLYAILVYANLYFLIPRFLLKRRLAAYMLFLGCSIILVTLASSQYLSFHFRDIHLSTSEFFLSLKGRIAVITEVIITLCLSMTLFLVDEWFKKERLIAEIRQEHSDLALGLLGNNQINPHLLFNSLNSIYTVMDKKITTEENSDHIFIKSDGMVIKVFVDDITHIETANDYVYINTTSRDRYLTLVSLSNMEAKLPEDKFIRVHRFYLVGVRHVKKIEGNLIHIGKTKIRISRALRKHVYESIIGDKLIER
ncbi:LytTR family transcriptional regulator DNA-binding domain-containing protein [Poritiphilus flavus]|uniref:HTH LytTR-type domain-containing protein n=1 Tax=Poritiphilus flavus TaxID=2697053 RepID=A0A6L9EH63_9FLAO|nr:LytTR family transcriptional regulator DNA-binding domain-containing protein [Poritiphilus flavus]NAS13589.1 hypothetical protein [Poritiphilus flavus]